MNPSGRDVLTVKGLTKYFPVRRGVMARTVGTIRAVDNVSFSIPAGSTLGLVGESGCGKTTVGRCVLRLVEPTQGEIYFKDIPVHTLKKKALRKLRRSMQIIFQDPYGSLNPRMTVYSMLAEILAVHRLCPRSARRNRVYELLEMAGLSPESADRYPHEFSGGQRQRIGIARALATEPELIIADEAVSALDVSIQAQILNLMRELQQKLGIAYLFISHDLSVVKHISDYVAVMYLGRIVEKGTVEQVLDNPLHPYTRALLRAAPVPDPERRITHVPLGGDVPSPLNPPSGCRFHPRCPDAGEMCDSDEQPLLEQEPGHWVACSHLYAKKSS